MCGERGGESAAGPPVVPVAWGLRDRFPGRRGGGGGGAPRSAGRPPPPPLRFPGGRRERRSGFAGRAGAGGRWQEAGAARPGAAAAAAHGRLPPPGRPRDPDLGLPQGVGGGEGGARAKSRRTAGNHSSDGPDRGGWGQRDFMLFRGGGEIPAATGSFSLALSVFFFSLPPPSSHQETSRCSHPSPSLFLFLSPSFQYVTRASSTLRAALKEPARSKAMAQEKFGYNASKWSDGMIGEKAKIDALGKAGK